MGKDLRYAIKHVGIPYMIGALLGGVITLLSNSKMNWTVTITVHSIILFLLTGIAWYLGRYRRN